MASRARNVADFIPSDGNTNQVLGKASSDPYDTEWQTGSGGGSVVFAEQSDYDAGTDDVSVNPDLGNVNYLTKSATGDGGAFQNINSDVGFHGDFVVATAAGRSEINRDTSLGSAGTPNTLTAANGTITGLDAANPVTIDFAVIDGGTF